MEQWWEILYEKRFKDCAAWAVPEDEYVKAQDNYIVLATNLKPQAEILDLGAGTGRHVALLTDKGYRVSGVEYSKILVEKGKALAPNINLVAGDMRELNGVGLYDAVTFFDTSFGIFDDKANAEMLMKVFNALKSDGWIVIDYLNPDFWKNKTDEMVMPNYRVKGDKFIRRYRYNENTYRLTESGRYVSPDGSSEDYPDQVLALYPTDKLAQMLRNAGFVDAAFYGSKEYDYPGQLQPATPVSAFISAVAKKI